jgi:hypothetical protein
MIGKESWFVFKVFTATLILLIAVALSSCQSAAPKWKMFRFDRIHGKRG